MPHVHTLDRKDLRGRVLPWSRAKAIARGRAWDLSCAQKGHQNLEWVADKVFHPACSMSDCLPSGLWLLVLWFWHVWTRSVFGKRSFLSRYQLTGLWKFWQSSHTNLCIKRFCMILPDICPTRLSLEPGGGKACIPICKMSEASSITHWLDTDSCHIAQLLRFQRRCEISGKPLERDMVPSFGHHCNRKTEANSFLKKFCKITKS